MAKKNENPTCRQPAYRAARRAARRGATVEEVEALLKGAPGVEASERHKVALHLHRLGAKATEKHQAAVKARAAKAASKAKAEPKKAPKAKAPAKKAKAAKAEASGEPVPALPVPAPAKVEPAPEPTPTLAVPTEPVTDEEIAAFIAANPKAKAGDVLRRFGAGRVTVNRARAAIKAASMPSAPVPATEERDDASEEMERLHDNEVGVDA